MTVVELQPGDLFELLEEPPAEPRRERRIAIRMDIRSASPHKTLINPEEYIPSVTLGGELRWLPRDTEVTKLTNMLAIYGTLLVVEEAGGGA